MKLLMLFCPEEEEGVAAEEASSTLNWRCGSTRVNIARLRRNIESHLRRDATGA